MSVRWYLAYSLSYRNIEELMAERGVSVDHATVNRWVIKYSAKLEATFSKRYKKSGAAIDFMLSKTRDEKAAKCFFTKAIGYSEKQEKVTIDKSGSNHAAWLCCPTTPLGLSSKFQAQR